MSSTGSGEQRLHRAAPAEQHLGDRLSAFVDGELTDDGRDRVLAHLATCPQCKTAAAEQRRLKSVVAASELPAISAGLLARLQGLPGMGGGDGRDGFSGGPGGPGEGEDPVESLSREARRGPFDGGLLGPGSAGSGVFGSAPARHEEFSYLGPARDLLAPLGSRSRGFRIHEQPRINDHPGMPEQSAIPERPGPVEQPPRVVEPAAAGVPQTGTGSGASRGRRFAFAAAGAFSLAAIALGSALPMEAAVDGGARPDDGPAVSPLGANSVSDTRGVTPRGVLDAEERQLLRAPGSASAGLIAVTRPMLGPGAVPLVTAAVTPAPTANPFILSAKAPAARH